MEYHTYLHLHAHKYSNPCLQAQLCTAMPKPPIPCSSTSDSLIATTHRRLPSSARSFRSSHSSSRPFWGRRALKQALSSPRSNSSRHSDLTEERLEEFNRRNTAPLSPSPYYKGLTDFSLVLHPRKRSPGRESHATTVTTSSSISTLLSKLHDITSTCFTSKSRRGEDDNDKKPRVEAKAAISASSSKTVRTALTVMKEARSSLGSSAEVVMVNPEKPVRERVSKLNHKLESNTDHEVVTILESDTDVVTVNLEKPLMMESGYEVQEISSSMEAGDEVVTASPEKPLRERVSEEAVEEGVPAPRKREGFVESGDTENDEDGTNKDFTWADKYRPKTLPAFICNQDKAAQLQKLVKMEQHQHRHFIFEGLPGVGKRTMIMAFLREVFGHHKVQTRKEVKEFSLKGESIRSIRVNVNMSAHHIEVNLSELKGYEKQVIVQLIHGTGNKKANKVVDKRETKCNHDNLYAIVLYEAEKLSTEGLLYFKWLLEKYDGCNMVFFSCSDISKLHPIKSLCMVMQLLPPSDEEILQVLDFIAKQEGIYLPQGLAQKMTTNSKNNLRQAIRSFEATRKFSYPFEEDQEVRTGWEDGIAKIAKNIIEEQSPKQLYIIRGKLQKLTEHNVASEFIYRTLVQELKKQLNCASLQLNFDSIFEDFYRDEESRPDNDRSFGRNRHEEISKRLNDPTRKNARDVLKIEESIAKFMSCYKSLLVSNQGIPSGSYSVEEKSQASLE